MAGGTDGGLRRGLSQKVSRCLAEGGGPVTSWRGWGDLRGTVLDAGNIEVVNRDGIYKEALKSSEV